MRPVLGAIPSMQVSPPTTSGYHGYPAYPYFPPYTAAQTGGYVYAPYYYPHWDYGPVLGSLETPLGTPGGESQEDDDDESKHHDDDETPTKDGNREVEYAEGGDDDGDETTRSV